MKIGVIGLGYVGVDTDPRVVERIAALIAAGTGLAGVLQEGQLVVRL